MKYLEMYIKENTLIQLPLFFFTKAKKTYICHTWEDSKAKYKMECDCRLGLPGAFEQDVYSSCMRIWVKDGMPKEGIQTNYSEIAREMGLNEQDNNQKIKNSIQKLSKARYKLTGCFINKEEKLEEDYEFSLFPEATTFDWKKGKSKKKSTFTLIFPEKVRKNLELKYYQRLDFSMYMSFSSGIARRLYEYLEKRRYHKRGGYFVISEEKLYLWLPITDSNKSRKRKTLEKGAKNLVQKNYLKRYTLDKKKEMYYFMYSEDLQEIPEQKMQNEKLAENEALKISKEAVTWLETIPYFHSTRIDEIKKLCPSHVARCYPGIKTKYNSEEKKGNKPSAGWVYKAITEGWEFEKQIQIEKKKAEKELEKKNLDKKKKSALEIIKKGGGQKNLTYKKKKFIVIENYGLEILGTNIIEPWLQVDLKSFEIINQQ